MENEFDFFNTLSGGDFDKQNLGNYGTFDYALPPSTIQPIDTSPPFLKGIETIDQPYQSYDGGSFGGGFSLPIDYDNLIIPSLESEQKNNIFTNAINKFKSLGDKNKLASGILRAGSFLKDPAMAIFSSVMGMLPEEDPRATAARNFYGENFGLKSDNRIASGIMENYNPVYGSDFLNKISQGIIPESGYGLDEVMGERMGNIKNMLSKKHKQNFSSMDDEEFETFIKSIEGQKLFRYGEKYGSPGYTSAAENFLKIKSLKQAQAMSAAAAEEKQKEKLLQKLQAEKAKAPKDTTRYATQGDNQSRSTSGLSYNQGGGKSGSYDEAGLANGGRIGYGTGGIVSL